MAAAIGNLNSKGVQTGETCGGQRFGDRHTIDARYSRFIYDTKAVGERTLLIRERISGNLQRKFALGREAIRMREYDERGEHSRDDYGREHRACGKRLNERKSGG